MSQRSTPYLPSSLLTGLSAGCPALLLTLGVDGFPNSAYTWTLALNNTTLRFAADHGSTTLANLERESRAALQIIAPGNLIFLIKGHVTLVKAQLEAAPFKVALMSLAVQEVKDQAWPDVRVAPLAYHWSPTQQEAMLAMEQAIFEEMRCWNG